MTQGIAHLRYSEKVHI